jgi:conjugal transfer pilus assembly protein TraW
VKRAALPILAGGCAMSLLFLVAASAPPVPRAAAHDLGRFGETWPVIEPDLLGTIARRLARAQASGELDRLNREFADRAAARVATPPAVTGLSPASEDRSWAYDPSIALDADVRDAKGALIAAKGTRVNPLDLVHLPRTLIFVDGTSADEMAWAQRQGDDAHASIILVAGSPFERMRALGRRIWFDQGGLLTGRFGIAHTPAWVRQQGNTLRVDEVALPRKGETA